MILDYLKVFMRFLDHLGCKPLGHISLQTSLCHFPEEGQMLTAME